MTKSNASMYGYNRADVTLGLGFIYPYDETSQANLIILNSLEAGLEIVVSMATNLVLSSNHLCMLISSNIAVMFVVWMSKFIV